MRAFIVLCLLAVSTADQLGYNYRPVDHSPAGLSFSPSSAASNAAPSFAPVNQVYSPGPSYSAPAPAASASAPSYSAPAPTFEKEFYSFSANDQDFVEPASSQQVNSVSKQHLQVIFVKGPEHNGLEDAAAALAKQASERRTAIYILNKQADISQLASKLESAGTHTNSKPEVHFVKYRTQEDAENAQRQIQSQYDALGGQSHSYNGEVAPAINFASSPVAQPQETATAPQSTYLPASIIKRLRV